MKKILIGLIVLIALIGIGVFYLFGQLDSIVEAAIEKYGSQVTQTSVGVGGVSLALTEGKGSISGLQVNNPAGFDTDYAFRMENISMGLDLEKISRELIVVKEIVVDGPSVIYELSKSGSNIDAIKKNVESFGGGGSAAQDDSAAGGPKLSIENLVIKNANMQVSSSMVKGKTLTAPIPAIHLKDIGKDSGGATPAEVAKQVISVLTKKASSVAGSMDLSSLMDAEMLKKLGADKVQEMGGEHVDKLKNIGGDAKEKLKKLF